MSLEQRRSAQEVERSAYDLDGLVEGLSSVPTGTNVLVSGPAMVGKTAVTARLLAMGFDAEHAVVISADRNARRIFDAFERVTGDVERAPLHVVDCSGTGSGAFRDTPRVKHVSDPGDLTGIGIAMVKCTRDVGEAARDGLRLGLVSVSTLLQYADPGRVFNFLHVLTGRTAAAGYLGVSTFDPTIHEDRVVNAVKSQFDGVLELRDADDGPEIRAVGFSGVDREWRPL